MSTTIASKEASSSSREQKRTSALLLIVAATVVCLVAGTVSWLVRLILGHHGPIRSATLHWRLTRLNGYLGLNLAQRSAFESPSSRSAFGIRKERQKSCRSLLDLQVVHFELLTLLTQQISSDRR
jgi:hypothetical protein